MSQAYLPSVSVLFLGILVETDWLVHIAHVLVPIKAESAVTIKDVQAFCSLEDRMQVATTEVLHISPCQSWTCIISGKDT